MPIKNENFPTTVVNHSIYSDYDMYSTTERDKLGNVQKGKIIWNSTLERAEIWNGYDWVEFSNDGLSARLDHLEASHFFEGWGIYADTQYTQSSPQLVSEGQEVILSNNKGFVNETQLPHDVTTFYIDGTEQKFVLSEVDDLFDFLITFDVINDANNGIFDLKAYSKSGTLYWDEQRASVGKQNSVQKISMIAKAIVNQDLLDNGGEMRIEAVSGNLQIFNVRYLIQRSFRHHEHA